MYTHDTIESGLPGGTWHVSVGDRGGKSQETRGDGIYADNFLELVKVWNIMRVPSSSSVAIDSRIYG